jgi:putative flippase GtrA
MFMAAGNALRTRPLKFLTVGLCNTAIGLSVIFAAKALFGIGDLAANVLGYGVGIAASFALNRQWTFRNRGRVMPALWRFFAAFAVAYSLNLIVVFGLRDGLYVNPYVAQALGIVPYTIFLYIVSARYVFPVQAPIAAKSMR